MEPKGPNLAQNGVERVPENIEKTMPEKRSAPGRLPHFRRVTKSRQFGRKGRPGDRFWKSFWSHFPSKMRSKIDPEIEPQKIMKKMQHCRTNNANNNEQSIRFSLKTHATYANALLFPN